MAYVSSIDKIVTSYFVAVTKEDFVFKEKLHKAKSLKVSPLLLRGFICPENCAGCCPVFSLDYLPTEQTPYQLNVREIEFNGKSIAIFLTCKRIEKNIIALMSI